ncbi:MAG: NFACT family protein, partial [Candidatus Eremiobacteraeota bacterium]|nr:NFACT family protein [Candidatus Eremiobacteraeota bacterium]
MTLDSWLVARLAVELERLLRGARVTGLRAHDRGLAVLCERRREACAFEVLLDPDRPLAAAVGGAAVTDESGPGGWAGGVAALLRGSVVDAVRAVPDDRILNVDLHSRSAFGVPAHHRLVVELEPRKSNAMIVRPAGDGAWSVLAAARRFAAQGTARSVAVGEPYEPPPPRVARIDRAAFLAAVRAVLTQPEHEARALVRLLNDFDPSCTPPLARRLVDELLSRPESLTGPPSEAGDSLLHAWQRLHDEVAAGAHDPAAPVFVYHQGDQVSACHVVTLPWAN